MLALSIVMPVPAATKAFASAMALSVPVIENAANMAGAEAASITTRNKFFLSIFYRTALYLHSSDYNLSLLLYSVLFYPIKKRAPAYA